MNTKPKYAKSVVGSALVATFLALTACGSGGQSGQTPASTATSGATSSSSATAAPTTAAQSQDVQAALQILDAIVRRDFTTATAHFDKQMRQTEPAPKLASDWAAYQQEFGNYQSHGDPQQVQIADLTVVNIPLQMQQAPGQYRVSFKADGTVAGLAFLKAGVPLG